MTVTYKTRGLLENPVSDLSAAREWLREHGKKMEQYIYPDEAKTDVHSVVWDLLSDHEWEVTLIADTELKTGQLEELSSWISGQNSDGLGEGFEQQEFSEQYDRNEWGDIEEETITMASFDWMTNNCTLEPEQ